MKDTIWRIIVAFVAGGLLVLTLWGIADYAGHCNVHTSSRLEDPGCR